MAGLLGFAIGSVANQLRANSQRKQQEQDKTVDLLTQAAVQNPGIIDNPDVAKAISKGRGKEFLGMLQMVGKIKQQQNQQFASVLGGGPPPQGGSAPTGQPSLMSMGAGQPQQGSAGPPTQPGQGGGQPTPPGSSAPSGPNLRNPRTVEDYRALKDRLMQAQASGMFNDPEHQKLLDEHIKDADTSINQLQHEQDYQQTQKRLDQAHQDSEQDRSQQRQLSAQEHSESLAVMSGLHEESLALQRQTKDFMQQMATTHEADAKQQHFTTASQSLQSMTSKIGGMLSSATPASPGTVQTLLRQRNALAATLAKQAKASGIDYDPDEFAPVTVKTLPGFLASHTGGAMGSSSSELAPADDAGSGGLPPPPPGVKFK